MKTNTAFWEEMQRLIATHCIVIDRPKGQPHPRYPGMIYPLDYSYLENTLSGDGDGIDVWIGSQHHKTLTGILCTFDTLKQDVEIKLLLGCTFDELESIRGFYGSEMKTLYIPLGHP